MKKILLLILTVACLFAGCKKDPVIPKPEPPKPDPEPPVVNIKAPPVLNFPIVAYFPYYRNPASVPDSIFDMCDIVNYAFFNVNANGNVTVNSPAVFDAVYNKAKATGAKVFASVAGDFTFTKDNNKILVFVKDMIGKVRQYKLDGVDIDWEYPRTTDGTDTAFYNLMKRLSDTLHVDGKYYLTAAITPGKYSGAIRDGIKSELFSIVDMFNVMIYDDADPHAGYAFFTTSLNYWLNTRKMPKEKFIAGIPIYGRGTDDLYKKRYVQTYNYILGQNGGPAKDTATIKNDSTSYIIHYNGTETVKQKTLDAKSRANGVMFWEMGQDATDERSLIRAAAVAAGKR